MGLNVKNKLYFLLLLFFLVSCSDTSLERLELIVGSKLPNNIKLIHEFEEWTDLNGDGYRIRAYELADNYGWIKYQHCTDNGLSEGTYETINLKVIKIEELIQTKESLCYKLISNKQDNELVILQEKKVLYYYSTF